MSNKTNKFLNTVIASDRIVVPSGLNLLNSNTRTITPSKGSIGYETNTELLYYGSDDEWLLLATGGGPFAFLINNTLFVDTQFGNDGTAMPYNEAKPWKTITAALAVATSGFTIYVQPGTYVEDNFILKDGVNWYFSEGVTLTNTNSGNPMFKDNGNTVTSAMGGYLNVVTTTPGIIFDITGNTNLIVNTSRDIASVDVIINIGSTAIGSLNMIVTSLIGGSANNGVIVVNSNNFLLNVKGQSFFPNTNTQAIQIVVPNANALPSKSQSQFYFQSIDSIGGLINIVGDATLSVQDNIRLPAVFINVDDVKITSSTVPIIQTSYSIPRLIMSNLLILSCTASSCIAINDGSNTFINGENIAQNLFNPPTAPLIKVSNGNLLLGSKIIAGGNNIFTILNGGGVTVNSDLIVSVQLTTTAPMFVVNNGNLNVQTISLSATIIPAVATYDVIQLNGTQLFLEFENFDYDVSNVTNSNAINILSGNAFIQGQNFNSDSATGNTVLFNVSSSSQLNIDIDNINASNSTSQVLINAGTTYLDANTISIVSNALNMFDLSNTTYINVQNLNATGTSNIFNMTGGGININGQTFNITGTNPVLFNANASTSAYINVNSTNISSGQILIDAGFVILTAGQINMGTGNGNVFDISSNAIINIVDFNGGTTGDIYHVGGFADLRGSAITVSNAVNVISVTGFSLINVETVDAGTITGDVINISGGSNINIFTFNANSGISALNISGGSQINIMNMNCNGNTNGIFVNGNGQLNGYIGSISVQQGSAIRNSGVGDVFLYFNAINMQGGSTGATAGICIHLDGDGDNWLIGNFINAQYPQYAIKCGDNGSGAQLVYNINSIYVTECINVIDIECNGGGVELNSTDMRIGTCTYLVNTINGPVVNITGGNCNVNSGIGFNIGGNTSCNINVGYISCGSTVLSVGTSNNMWYNAVKSITQGNDPVVAVLPAADNNTVTIGGYFSSNGVDCVNVNVPTGLRLRILGSILISTTNNINAIAGPVNASVQPSSSNQNSVNTTFFPAGAIFVDPGVF